MFPSSFETQEAAQEIFDAIRNFAETHMADLLATDDPWFNLENMDPAI